MAWHSAKRGPQYSARVHQDVSRFENKGFCRTCLDDEGDKAVVKIKRPTKACWEMVEKEIKAWSSFLRDGLLRAVDVGARAGGFYNTSKLYVVCPNMFWRY